MIFNRKFIVLNTNPRQPCDTAHARSKHSLRQQGQPEIRNSHVEEHVEEHVDEQQTVSKTRNHVSKTGTFVLKMMNCVLKIMNFADRFGARAEIYGDLLRPMEIY